MLRVLADKFVGCLVYFSDFQHYVFGVNAFTFTAAAQIVVFPLCAEISHTCDWFNPTFVAFVSFMNFVFLVDELLLLVLFKERRELLTTIGVDFFLHRFNNTPISFKVKLATAATLATRKPFVINLASFTLKTVECFILKFVITVVR